MLMHLFILALNSKGGIASAYNNAFEAGEEFHVGSIYSSTERLTSLKLLQDSS